MAKLRSPSVAQPALGEVGLHVPPEVVRLVGAAEVVAGGWAAIAPSGATAALVAFAYGAFAVFALVSLRAGGPAPCGCFVASGSELSLGHALFNAVGCSIAVLAAYLAFTAFPSAWRAYGASGDDPPAGGRCWVAAGAAHIAAWAVGTRR